MQHVEGGGEELVGVLLLVAGHTSDVLPHQVEQLVEAEGRLVARVELLKEIGDLADEAAGRLGAVVPVGEEVVTEQGRVDQGLHDAVHEARAAEVYQATETWNVFDRWLVAIGSYRFFCIRWVGSIGWGDKGYDKAEAESTECRKN